ncbi:hypothetical protein [Streptomyces zhihengii]|uniref:hypothetical protein n=1 Tax=Streptomyces zhihengii TaxID=1818004 RepID=UPI0033B4349A
MHQLRTQLTDQSGLGLDSYNHAHQAIGDTSRNLDDLKSRLANGRVELGRSPVTADQVAEATHRYTRSSASKTSGKPAADPGGTQRTRPGEELDPSGPEGMAARAARITAQSRERALPSPTLLPGPKATPQPQQQNVQAPQTALHPGTR